MKKREYIVLTIFFILLFIFILFFSSYIYNQNSENWLAFPIVVSAMVVEAIIVILPCALYESYSKKWKKKNKKV